jgi:hypothetical protein
MLFRMFRILNTDNKFFLCSEILNSVTNPYHLTPEPPPYTNSPLNLVPRLEALLLTVYSMIRGKMLKTNITNQHYYLIVTKTTLYALRAARPRAAERPARAYSYDHIMTSELLSI